MQFVRDMKIELRKSVYKIQELNLAGAKFHHKTIVWTRDCNIPGARRSSRATDPAPDEKYVSCYLLF